MCHPQMQIRSHLLPDRIPIDDRTTPHSLAIFAVPSSPGRATKPKASLETSFVERRRGQQRSYEGGIRLSHSVDDGHCNLGSQRQKTEQARFSSAYDSLITTRRLARLFLASIACRLYNSASFGFHRT